MKERLFILSQHLLPHHLLSRLIGHAAECRARWLKTPLIRWFARRYQVDMREAQVESLDASVRMQELALRDTKIVAPISGVIARRYAKVGQLITEFSSKSLSVGLKRLIWR